jgi:hypothetical protein
VFCLSGFWFHSAAQEAQRIFEDSWFSGEWLNQVVSTTDSGQVICINETQKIKLDALGNALWCRSYDFDTFLERAMPDGGTISLNAPSFNVRVGPVEDTLEMECSLMKLDANGDVEWARTLSAELLGDRQLVDIYYSFHLDTDEEGHIALAVQCNALSPKPIWVVHLDEDGTVVWSRAITDPDPSLYLGSVALDGYGAVYLLSWHSSIDLFDPAKFGLYKIDIDGELEWIRRGSTSSGGIRGGSLVCANGQPVIGALEYSGPNFYGYVIRFQRNGGLEWRKKYFGPGSTNDNQDVWELHALANGELIAAHYEPNWQWSEELIAHIAVNGSVIDAAREVPMDIADYSFHVDWGGIDVRGSTVAIATSVHRQAPWDLQPGLAGFWTLGLDLEGCMLGPVTVSVSGFNMTFIGGDLPIISEPEVDVVSFPVSTSELVAPQSAVACNLPMSTDHPSVDLGTFDVRPTVTARGKPIYIRSSSAGSLEVRDVTGRSFKSFRIAANVPVELNTTELCSGVYLLCKTNGAGVQELVRKVLVE